MSEAGRKALEAFKEFLADRGALFLQWVADALAKIANLQFHELTIEEAPSSLHVSCSSRW